MTPQEVRTVFAYAPETGRLLWNIVTRKTQIGDVAGGLSNGYMQVKYKQRKYMVHRIIWCYVHGDWPNQMIDHIDGDRSNNKIANLRDVSNAKNQYNRHSLNKNNSTGHMGIMYRKRGDAYIVQIRVLGARKYIGYYKTLPDAIIARQNAELLWSRT
jgi:hypothetical protein